MSLWEEQSGVGPGPQPAVYAPDRAAWRAWLAEHHDKRGGVWIVYYKKGSGRPRIPYPEMVKECLCFGWIDSKVSKWDDARYLQWITPRKPKSVWSKLNKSYIEELERENLLTPAGLLSIEIAKANGSWSVLDTVEALEIPDDLARALAAHPEAESTFERYSPSVKKMALTRLVAAKRPETRQRRLEEILTQARAGKKSASPSWERAPSPER